jgi:AIPR protein
MKHKEREDAYALISRLASRSEATGLEKERSVLLLWFLRNVVGLDEFEAYDYICDGDSDSGIDALYLEEGQGEDDIETLVIFQSYFPETPKDIGPTKLDRLITAANHFKTEAALSGFLAEDLEPPLRRLISKFELVDKLANGRFDDDQLRIRLTYVTTGILNKAALRLSKSTNEAEVKGYLSVYDLRRLADIAAVVAAPDSEVDELVINCNASERLILPGSDGANQVVIVPVQASSIVKWDGIEDRRLFALNVRGELRRNRVSRQLDAAIRRQTDHADFLASHNGMTVTCDHIEEKRGKLVVKKPSVVNGAQSVIAFWRGEQDGVLTDDLQVFVKLVEVAGRPQFGSSVSSRSNTQTAVSARNLVANTGPQRRLLTEFADRFPGVLYEVKYDDSLAKQHTGPRIANDEAAQLLCAVYNQKPWLAVKRTSLFEADNYPDIFNEKIHAEHIVLVDLLKQEADKRRDDVPEHYRRSWILTRLVLIYLVGQVLRTDETLGKILNDPAIPLADRDQLANDLKRPFSAAVLTLKKRRDQRERDDEDDDFRVDFKNTDELRKLRDQARDTFLTLVEADALKA